MGIGHEENPGLWFFFCALFFLRFHILWKHTGFIWNSSCEGVQLDAIFLPVQKKNVPSNNDLVAGICYAHRQHRLYLAPSRRPMVEAVSQSLWIRAAKGLRTLIHRWQCYSFWTVCWHCSSKKVPAIPRHPWWLKRIDMLQLFQWQRPLFFTLMSSYVTNDRVEGEMGWFTMIYIHLLTYSILSYPVLFFSVNTPVMVALFQPGMPPCSHATHVSSNPGFMVRASIDEETLMDMAAPTPAAQCSNGAIATPQSCGLKDQK